MKKLVAPLSFCLSLVLVGTASAWGWVNGTVSGTAETIVRNLVTDEHARVCGGDQLAYHAQLMWMARYKAMDMGLHDKMSHYFEDGTTVFSYYGEAGISKPYGAAEIIAWNNYPDEESPGQAFQQWMNSDAHRRAIRNCDYDRFGVGAFKTKNPGGLTKKWYVVEFTNVSP